MASAIIGGLLVGLIEQLSATYISPKSSDILVYVLLLAILVTGSLGSGRIDVSAYGWKVPLVIIGFCACIQLVIEVALPIRPQCLGYAALRLKPVWLRLTEKLPAP